jgi:hypothetical protein
MLAHVVNSNSSSRALSSSAADSGSLTAGPLTAVTLAPFTACHVTILAPAGRRPTA